MAFVQASTGYAGALPGATTAGNLLALAVVWTDSLGTNPSFSGFTAAGAKATVDNNSIQGFYKYNDAGGMTNLPTPTWDNGTPGAAGVWGCEYDNIPSSGSPLAYAAQVQATPGTGTDAITSGVGDVTAQPAVVIGFGADVGGGVNISAGTGYTQRYATAAICSEDKFVTATGNQAATFTAASAPPHSQSVMMAFAEAGSGADQVTLEAPLATTGFRLRTTPDLADGDIVEYEVYAGTGDIVVNTDGSFVADATVTHFRYRVDDGGGFGDWVIDEVQPAVIRPATIVRLPAIGASGSGTVS